MKTASQKKQKAPTRPDPQSDFSALLPAASLPLPAKVVRTERENELVTLLTLDMPMPQAMPGQFVMVWKPGMDEKPMSVAEVKPTLTLAIARAGPCSKKLADSAVGDIVYVRGPLGKPFWPVGRRWLMVGGGYGFAPLRYLARLGLENGMEVQSICGARNKGLLMKSAPGKNHITTDDGSAGTKGNVLTALEPLLAEGKFDCVYACGPEKMMKAVAECAKRQGVKSQLSVERYMKCGIGVCGHCAMGGWLSCVDGPSIDGEEALANPAFGVYHTDRAGRKIKY